MSDIKSAIEAVMKFGAVPVLMLWVWSLDSQLKEMRAVMFDCFEDREQILKNKTVDNERKNYHFHQTTMYAVLPKCDHENIVVELVEDPEEENLEA